MSETVYKMMAEPNAQPSEILTIKPFNEGIYYRDVIVNMDYIPSYKTYLNPSHRHVSTIPEHISLSLKEQCLDWMVVYLTYEDAKRFNIILEKQLKCFGCKDYNPNV